ncbi:ATP-binding protein [Salmonella enterica]|nr:ATP-binding protein [Salmonella enterica]EGW1916294.1 ATP-binding protein [Salmonella enterica]
MSDTNLSGPSNGGGAATSSGIVFQQQLGAFFAAQILSNDPLDPSLVLGDAAPVRLRFETEAPVDDILVATSVGGFLAIQVKTTVPLSDKEKSPFYRTIEQFVQHWLTCRDGDGSLAWNRPLSPEKDRLILAVSTKASATVRTDLSAALRHLSQQGRGAMNRKQKSASDIFERCVLTAWGRITTEPRPSDLLAELARLIVVHVVDVENIASTLQMRLSRSLARETDSAAALSILVTTCGEMMSRRDGCDALLLRNMLAGKGIKLAAPPQYQADIHQLIRHSQHVANVLQQYETIDNPSGQPLTLHRECQDAVEQAVQSGSLLIIGEPGAGKSGVLNALARSLRNRGDDVLELAVDHYSVESLEGLSRELRLDHCLTEVLEAWDGTSHGWLIIDALDATRGGKGEAVFRPLIEQVLNQKGRWRVIASIRSFDLRMGVKLRDLFKGHPPVSERADTQFSSVRHIVIPRWSDNEFSQLLEQSSALTAALKQLSDRLRDLAKVPFNTRLLADLVSQYADINLSRISSQSELLKLYWQYRVEKHGLNARQCLKALVDHMIATRSLRAPSLLTGTDADMIDTLSREGVVLREANDRWVQFRHHLLFDYAAAKISFDPDALIAGTLRFPKQQAQGLLLSPALGFVLQEIWDYNEDHHGFWQAVSHLVNDSDGDPIIRSSTSRIAAEYPVAQNDLLWLAKRVAMDDQNVISTLSHLCGALAIRFEDEKEVALLPWVYLVSALTPDVNKVAETLRFLLHPLTKQVTDPDLRNILGTACRAVLSYGLKQSEPGYFVRNAIPLVADTINTDVDASCRLLEQIISVKRLQHFGSEEIPVLCYNIKKIADRAPEFVACVFEFVYRYDVTEERETTLGNSRILPLRSNVRQDYESARYSLGEFFSHFLEQHPEQAVDAAVNALNGYVARRHPVDAPVMHLSISGNDISLKADHSHIWAYNPTGEHAHDGEVLVKKLFQHLKSATEPDMLVLAELIRQKASLAIFWARLFLAANERNDSLVDFLWPIAAQEAFIRNEDTCKDAIDLVSKGIARRPLEERQMLENAAFQYNFSGYIYPEDAKKRLLYRLFNAIGSDNLSTEAARDFLKNTQGNDEISGNKRLFDISPVNISTDIPYDFIEGLDRNEPANAMLISAVKTAKTALGLTTNNTLSSELSLEDVFGILEPLREQLNTVNIHTYVRTTAEDVIVRACAAAVEQKLLPPANDNQVDELTPHFLDLLHMTSRAISPTVNEDTEDNFANSVSWGSPSPRIDAARIFLDVIPLRPDLYDRLKPDIERMLIDPHPAVRLQASTRLLRLWNIAPESVWHYLNQRVEQEINTGIIEHMVGDGIRSLLYTDPTRSFCLIQKLLGRFSNDPERQHRIRKIVSIDLAILWGVHEIREAHDIIQCWIVDPTIYSHELEKILFTLRDGFVLGFAEQSTPKDIGIRRRALDIAYSIIDAAGKKLEEYSSRTDLTEIELEDVKRCFAIIDGACLQLRFVCEGKHNPEKPSGKEEVKRFLNETELHMRRIGDCSTPHTIYYLLELLETFVPVDPAKCFDLMAHALRHGTKFGFQNEHMGMEQLVKMMGVFLADYKIIFEEEHRRTCLIESLDIFMDAGWPSARRLLYRLPELIQ